MTSGYAEGTWERSLWALWAAEKPGRHRASCRIVAKPRQGGWVWQLTTLQGFDRIRTYMWCQSFPTCHFQFVLLGEDIRPRWHLECSCQCHNVTKDTAEPGVGLGAARAQWAQRALGCPLLWRTMSPEWAEESCRGFRSSGREWRAGVQR